MTGERIQRRIDALLDQAEAASDANDWGLVADKARAVLAMDPDNGDAAALLRAADANLSVPASAAAPPEPLWTPAAEQPSSFAGGRYEVRRFLGEGGKKRVFLAHDERLDRDVAFALIKTAGLDEVGRERIVREAQAMGRLGAHPHVVTIFEIGEEGGAPYVVTELMGGGDVEGLLEKEGGALPLERTLEIAKGVARGLAFAHERGIVHRDLKPGNVWLTADGVAKIGDFGLAVALNRSRLTQHGLMVGTFGYMPPEQALGREVTPQADLYSLGAMLYELVTGKPPFQADDPTAVISQHINTPPVAPSWHSEHCPPDLEALILKLLAKVPVDRPASASEVLEALERVDPEGRSASHSESSANPLERLARGVFVGRERELERLRSAFDEAFAGRGSVVMLVGEPGIGKTRTSMELETYARLRGARVAWGRAHEAAGAPPYRPWIQVADTYSSNWGLEGVASQLGFEDVAELSRIFPLLRQQPGYVVPPEAVDPAAAQFRLFEAYTRLLRAFAAESPLVVVLDDLHWADKPTLLLLQHVARELPRLRILVVGTYRDTELSRSHPLSEALAELNREGGFQRVSLGGLSRNEVANYIRTTAGIEPARALAERVYEETEGNPFFLREVVNLMTEEGTISSASVADIAIPEGVREALGRRLDRLSDEANALLQYAAVAGRQFAYDTLRLVAEHDDDTLLRLIEQGLAARVIEETAHPGRYQFTHALMQETLLEELSTTRRVRMHGQIAEAIEARYGDRADEQAARLAMHYLESSTLNADHARKAMHYSKLAAQAAERSAAWAEAARHLDSIISLVDERDTSQPLDFAEILIALGRAKRTEGDPRPGWRALMRARDMARVDDPVGFAEATLEAVTYLSTPERLVALVEEALDVVGEDYAVQRALLLGARLVLSPNSVPQASFLEAERLAAATDTRRVLADLESARGHSALFAGDPSAAEHFRSASEQYLELGFADGASFASLLRGLQFGLLGDLTSADTTLREALDLCRRLGTVTPMRGVLWWLGGIARARADEAGLRDALIELGRLVNDHYRLTLQALDHLEKGDLDLAIQAASEPVFDPRARVRSTVEGVRARVLWHLGQFDDARRAFGHWRDLGLGAWPSIVDELLWLVGSHDELQAGYALLMRPSAPAEWGSADFELAWAKLTPNGTVLDRIRGDFAFHLDLVDEAEQHYRVGLEWCERERCPVEAGRCHQGLAEVAERRSDHTLAMQHLDAAGALFAEWGAKLYLDQVLAKKEILKA